MIRLQGPEREKLKSSPNSRTLATALVPLETVHKCLQDYVRASRWKANPVCAVCARPLNEIEETKVQQNDYQ
jgi:hypothetical protein